MTVDEVSRPKRILYLVLGWTFFGLGLIGVLLPVVPTTPFMLLAAWAFSKSSRRFEAWLLRNKYFGPGIRRFRAYRVIPVQAKVISLGAMSITLIVSVISGKIPWWGLLGQGLLMALAAWFTLRCPSHVPPGSPELPSE